MNVKNLQKPTAPLLTIIVPDCLPTLQFHNMTASTTAAFPAIHCHCGKWRSGECGSECLWRRSPFPEPSTTAAFPAIHCHCGKGGSGECGSERLWRRSPFPEPSTTAAFPAIHCRCGRMGGKIYRYCLVTERGAERTPEGTPE